MSGSGYKFYHEKLNSAKFIIAPMVDQSELAWRLFSKKYGAQLCYTPMMHAAVFIRDATYRKDNFQTCAQDRPLIVQFCSDDPDTFLKAAKLVENSCDAVDLNLGCPQGIARRGHYGCFLQDEWELIYDIINKAVKNLSIPVTAKIRVFEDINRTIEYAKMLENAGVSLLAVHGRTREQKGAQTGLASWKHIKAVKDNVKIPVFANGNLLYPNDISECLSQTGCDGVMIAEGSLYNPAFFTYQFPPAWQMVNEYLNFTKSYECSMPIIKGHIFKIFHKIFEKHLDLRDKFTKLKTISEINNFTNEVENICLSMKDENKKSPNNDLYYWQCQPYLRPLVSNTNENPNKTEENEKTEVIEQLNDPKNDIKLLRKKRHAEKLLRKRNATASLGSKNLKRRRYEICVGCNNPRSLNCEMNACRNCCLKIVISEKKCCESHGFLKNRSNL